jgi:hypothetical protein
MQVGDLTVDISQAEVGGFASGKPRVGDRVIVQAESAPVGGELDAAYVSFGAGVPRGATHNIVSMNGLLTNIGPNGVLAVEGRAAGDLHVTWDNESFRAAVCDPAKLRPDLRMSLIAVGLGPDAGLGYLPPLCDYGRWHDSGVQGPTVFGGVNHDLEFQGSVTFVDAAERILEVGGVRFHDIPGSLLTHYEATPEPGSTTPVTLEDVQVGDKVQIGVSGTAFENDIRPIAAAWFGEVPLDDGKFSISTRFDSSSNGDLVTYSGIRIAIDAGAELWTCDRSAHYEDGHAYLDALTRYGQPSLWISGRVDSARLVAEQIGAGQVDCGSVDAGPDQTVVAGSLVRLGGDYAINFDWGEVSWSWSQTAGPTVTLGQDHSQFSPNASFTAPRVSSPIDLVFELSVTADREFIGIDSVTIHVTPAE